jgi:hypothetical protein
MPTQLITGRKYFEVNIVSGNSALTFYLQPEGINPENGTVQQNRIVRVGGANTGAASGIDINNADGTASGDTTAPAGTRVLGLDVDTGTGNARVFLNGDLQGTGTGYTGNRVLHLIINGQTGDYEVHFNGGQQPFLHRPAGLTDANNLQTQNLPAAPIPNGRDHFQAITDTGANILTAAQTAFPNGLWWIKDRVNGNQHQLVDSVRGTTNETLNSPGGGYTNAYSAPSGSSVAWCWNYNSSDVSENGFNIIEFTGADDDPQTIDTGLTNPQFVIYASDSSSGIRAQHASYQPGLLEFNTSSQGVGYSACTFSGGNVNIDGALIGGSGVMYAWEPVEGFSKFGSYTGNGNADGTFVYLGFKPALIILKSSTDAFDWQIYDSTRSPTNPALLTLRPNQTASEVTSGNDLDILSNGFKARDNGSINNNSGSTYLYMAFAESPFGGENTAPANAR